MPKATIHLNSDYIRAVGIVFTVFTCPYFFYFNHKIGISLLILGGEKIKRILALDQSTKTTGYSVWHGKKLVHYGTVSSNINQNNPFDRMCNMYFEIKDLIEIIRPEYVCIESVQFQNNYNTYSQLSQLQGVIFSLLFEKNLPFILIEPTAWRKFCKISGRKRDEQKAATIQMVKERYGVDVTEDEADSIGIGLWIVNAIKD